jgi:hypothetical protein
MAASVNRVRASDIPRVAGAVVARGQASLEGIPAPGRSFQRPASRIWICADEAAETSGPVSGGAPGLVSASFTGPDHISLQALTQNGDDSAQHTPDCP